MRRALLVLVSLAVVLLVVVATLAPPARTQLLPEPDTRIVRGALHVHTTVSDGAGTPEQVAHGGAQAGLDFIVLTDHGDGTRAPVPPRYVEGVLLIDAVEISTTGGHYVALGLGQTPYRLAGEPRDVIEDVTRLGGFGIAAHPDSPKAELSWREWQAPFDGVEWLNADSAWRDEPRSALARALISYWLRGPEVIASLLDRPVTTLARWDALNKRRAVVGLAGHDAHARMGPRGQWEPANGEYNLRLPAYEATFRTFSLSAALDTPLTRTDADRDAVAVIGAVRAGRVTTVIDGLAGPARLAFTATHAGGRARMGGEVGPGIDVTLNATLVPPTARADLQLLKNGVVVARSTSGKVAFAHTAQSSPAVYRIEALWDGAPGTPPVPWVVGNPIRVGFAPARARVPLLSAARWARPVPVDGWRVEQHPASVTHLTPTILTPINTAWTLTWQLGGGNPAGQYAAMVVPVPQGFFRGADRLSFTLRSKAPMRISVQFRTSDDAARWQRSTYASPAPTEHSVAVRELTPVGAAPGTRLDLTKVDTILFVIDTVNTAPGAAGEVWVSEVRAEGVEN